MEPLQKYVDGLFRRQHLTAEVIELKEEILSNMIAKRDDLMAQGMSADAATQTAMESLPSIDGLLEGTQLTRINRYHTECLQNVLLNCTVFWICSMPLLFTSYVPFSYAGLLATAIFGVLYLISKSRKTDKVTFMSVPASRKRGKTIWIVWGLFFLVAVGMMAAVTFGSNLWFGRPVNITGPYQMANLAVRFYVPLLTIVIPITVSGFTKVLIHNKKRDSDE